jgi:hypothetical protein
MDKISVPRRLIVFLLLWMVTPLWLEPKQAGPEKVG